MNFIEENLIPVLALTIAFGLPAVIVSIYYKYESNRDRLRHESLQLLITSGQGVTPENLRGIPGFKEIAPRNDARRGVLTIGLGLGITCLGVVGLGDFENPVTGLGLCIAVFGLAMTGFGVYQKSAAKT